MQRVPFELDIPFFKQFGVDLPKCETQEDIFKAVAVIYETWMDSYEAEQGSEETEQPRCKRPCTSRKYELQTTPMSFHGKIVQLP